jgi:hypothetical protein
MNWFKLISILIGIGSKVADEFVKNQDSKKTKEAVVTVVTAVVEGLANQNPDGTPATEAYKGESPAKVGSS